MLFEVCDVTRPVANSSEMVLLLKKYITMYQISRLLCFDATDTVIRRRPPVLAAKKASLMIANTYWCQREYYPYVISWSNTVSSFQWPSHVSLLTVSSLMRPCRLSDIIWTLTILRRCVVSSRPRACWRYAIGWERLACSSGSLA